MINTLESQLVTKTSLLALLHALGNSPGQTLLVHTSLSRLGFVCGGAQTVIEALLAALGPQGTLMMPTHTSENSEPSRWCNPPVPEPWWPTIRDQTLAFDPQRTPSRGMGVVAELFRTWPGAQRSAHPQVSFAALGPKAKALLDDHALTQGLGERSPIGRLYALDGSVLLLGATHSSNTSLHLSEHRAHQAGAITLNTLTEGAACADERGQRQWCTFETLDVDADDFEQLGAAWEADPVAAPHVHRQRFGHGEVALLRQRPLVDFGVAWLSAHRR